jgi:hypothetical protein
MTLPSVVLDTNVAIVANGDAVQADVQCVRRCLQELEATRDGRLLLLDDAGLILHEYLKQKPHGFPQGVGDAFLVWVYDNQSNPAHIGVIPVTPLPGDPRGLAEFPDDPQLRAFDQDDRKFVAVALASGTAPPILNATDTDWWIHRSALNRNGVRVEFLCSCLMNDGA